MKLQRYRRINQIYHVKNTAIQKAKGRISGSGVFERLITAVKNAEKGQKRAGRNLFAFLIFMLVMTIIARGASGATLAVVKTEMTYTGEVVEAIKGTATVTTSEKQDIIVPEGFTVEAVYVSEGDKIQEGDLIFKVNVEELKLRYDQEMLEIDNLNLKLEQLRQSIAYDDSALSSAKNTLTRAREDYTAAKSSGEQAIANAQSQYNTAKSEYEAAQKSLEALQTAQKNQTVSEAGDEEYEASAAEDTIDYEEQIASAKELVSSKSQEMKAAEAAITEAGQQHDADLRAAGRVIEDAESAVSAEEKNAANTQQENSLQERQNQVDAKSTQLEIDEVRKTATELDSFIQANGEVKSETTGDVISILQPGEKTTEAAVSSISNDNGMLAAEMTLTKAVAESISVGTTVELGKSEGGIQSEMAYVATVASISGAAGDSDAELVTIKLQFSEEYNVKAGESLTAHIIIKSGQYQNCVPLSALRSNSTGDYILVVEDKQTVLGTEKAVYAVPVTVESMGDSDAAIAGDFSSSAQIVVSSSKEVSHGDRVRLSS